MFRYLIVISVMITSIVGLRAQSRGGSVDVFMGTTFNYRDIYHNRVYDVLINLTPGFKWHPGNNWEITAAANVPIINQYAAYYGKVSVNTATVSKQWGLFDCWRLKVSGGWFNTERYGLDVKNMVIITDWLAATAQVGLTGLIKTSGGWVCSPAKRLCYLVGPVVYLKNWNTEVSLRAGRYVFDDRGAQLEIMRHYRHTTVGVYATINENPIVDKNFGFKIVTALPPYNRTKRRVNFRPAGNFRLTYSYKAARHGNYMYMTDPEENEREGWFSPDLLPWGANKYVKDFNYSEPKKQEEAAK